MTHLNSRKVTTCIIAGKQGDHTFWYVCGKTGFLGIAVLTKAETDIYPNSADTEEANAYIASKIKVHVVYPDTGYWPAALVCLYKDTPDPKTNMIFQLPDQVPAYSFNYHGRDYKNWWKELSMDSEGNWGFSKSKAVKPMTMREPDEMAKVKDFIFTDHRPPAVTSKHLAKVHQGNGRILFKVTGSFSLK